MGFPLTSIIILTKNNIQFTERCIWSIFTNVDPLITPYEIIILDENSIDGTKEFCDLHKDKIKYVDGQEYKTFSSRNNYGAKIAKGEYLWFLNNDVELINENLFYMLRHFADPKIGLIGSMHLFPNGTLNHIGIGVLNDFTIEHIFPNEDPNLPYINHGREIDIVTAASVIFRREVFEHLNGFDEDYSWGFEDADICLRARQLGYKIYCDTEAKMIHHGQSTYGRQSNDDKNKEIFLQKWKGKLKPDFEEIYKEKTKYYSTLNTPSRLVDKVVGKTISLGMRTAKNLSRKNNEEETIHIPKSDVYIVKSKNFSAFSDVADRMSRSIKDQFTLIESINQLYQIKDIPPKGAMSFSTSHFYEEYIYPAPDFIRDYRTFDINYERTDYSNPDYWIESLKRNKMILLASSTYCADFLIKSGVPKERVHIAHHGYNPSIVNFDFPPAQKNPEDKINILVIINTNDEERYGNIYLVEALELLRKNNPKYADKIKLIIKNYGGKGTDTIFKAGEYDRLIESKINVEYISSFLSENDLAKLYYRADLFIAPFRGEGFGMKILDAAATGLPIISPFYGGPTDFLQHSTNIPVKYNLIPASGNDHMFLMQDKSYIWAGIDSKDLEKQIIYAMDNIVDFKKDALSKRDKIRQNYSYARKWEIIKSIDQEYVKKHKFNFSNFEFFNEEIALDRSTSTYELLNENEIQQTLLINTINKYDNLDNTFEHIIKYSKIEDLKGEILIIDDGSKEDPSDFLNKFDALPIRYIKYSKWHGVGFSKDFGLRYAKGDNIIIIGDDIKPMPGFFQRHFNFYKNHKEPYLLMGHVEWDPSLRNDPIAEFATKITNFQFGFEEIRNSFRIDFTHVYTSNISFRRSDIVKAKQHFHTELTLFEDGTWAKDLEDKGFTIYYDRKAYALHRHHIKSTFIEWFIDRAYGVGLHSIQTYCVNPKYDEFISVKKVADALERLYERTLNEKIDMLSRAFDKNKESLVKLYNDLANEDKKDGYNFHTREQMYKILTQLNNLNRIYGIATSINPNNSEEVLKALAFSYFNTDDFTKNDTTKMPGFFDSLRMLVATGRNRLPVVFDPIYRIGKYAKEKINH